MCRISALIVLLCAAITLPACGGGSSSTSSGNKGPNTVPTNAPPLLPGGNNDPGGQDDPVDEIDAHRLQWEALGITNYDFTLQRTAFTVPLYTTPVIVSVRAGQVVSRTYAATGNPVAPQDASWWPDIPGLFAILADARDRNAQVLVITWNAQYGYPAVANIDYDLGLGDDEHDFGVTNFTPR